MPSQSAPPREAFLQFASISDPKVVYERIEALGMPSAHELDESTARGYLTAVSKIWAEHGRRISASTVFNWFKQHDAFRLAMTRAVRASPDVTMTDYIEHHVKRVMQAFEKPSREVSLEVAKYSEEVAQFDGGVERLVPPYQRSLSGYEALRVLREPVFGRQEFYFYRGLAEAYYRYFYQPLERRIAARESVIEFERALREIEAVMERHGELLAETLNANEWAMDRRGWRADVNNLRSSVLSTAQTIVHRRVSQMPSVHNDEYLKERFLLWDIRRVVTLRFGPNKTSTIERLFDMDGVRKISHRNLAKRLAEWKEAEEELRREGVSQIDELSAKYAMTWPSTAAESSATYLGSEELAK